MSINLRTSVVLLSILLQSALIYAQSEHCYFCNSEVHGQGCHDPINPNEIQIQACSDSEIVEQDSHFSSIWSFFKDHSLEKTETKNINTTNICLYMTYQFDFRNVSVRGCETDQRQTQSGVFSICDYYRRLAPVRISNFNCTVCGNNLCNHAHFIEESIADGSESISISFQLVTALLVTKVLLL